jgi:23S rRNA pseudouridine1911/1915/1917 synthase
VVGDLVYSAGGFRRITGPGRLTAERIERAAPRQALHAAELRFHHPVSGKRLVFASEWPGELGSALVEAAGRDAQVDPASALTYLGFFRFRTDD